MSSNLRDNIVATLIVTALLALVGWVVSVAADDTVTVALAISAGWLAAGVVTWLALRTRVLGFARYISDEGIAKRIKSAQFEIWSYQISGGDFTVEAVDAYSEWLNARTEYRLNVLFANPENVELLAGIVKLGGLDKQSGDELALAHLQAQIRVTLGRYVKLNELYDSQVDIKVYDCSPPCSIHAVDPLRDLRSTSIFVENYLPDVSWQQRPCFVLNRRHKLLAKYIKSCEVWFNDASDYVVGEREGTVA